MNGHETPQTPRRLLLFFGALLFLAGIVTGFFIPVMENPRVGLSSHLEGVMNGLFLIALFAVWVHVGLSGRLERLTVGLVVFASYSNWLATLLSAIWGTGSMMPIAAAGRQGTPIQEAIVSGMLLALSFSLVIACVILVWAALRGIRTESNAADTSPGSDRHCQATNLT